MILLAILLVINSVSAVWIHPDTNILVINATLNTRSSQNFTYVEINPAGGYVNLTWSGANYYHIDFITSCTASPTQIPSSASTTITTTYYSPSDWSLQNRTTRIYSASGALMQTDYAIPSVQSNSTHQSTSYTYTPAGLAPADYGIFRANISLYTRNSTLTYNTSESCQFQVVRTPNITTNATTNNSYVNVTLNSCVYDAGGVCNCWFEYGKTTSYGDTSSVKVYTTLGPKSNDVTSLLPGSFYHYRAVAQNVNGTSYGSDMTFTTYILTSTDTPTPVTDTIFTLAGTANYTTNASCGFWYGNVSANASNLASGLVTNVSCSGIYDSASSFSKQVPSLTVGEYYYVRSWAKNLYRFNTSSNQGFFLTKPTGPLNLQSTSPTSTSVSLSWFNGTSSVTNRSTVIVYKTGSYPTSPTDGTEGLNVSSNHGTITNLTPDIQYYFSAFTYINASGSPFLYQYSSQYVWTTGTTVGGIYNISVRWENTSYHPVDLTTGQYHTLVIQYTNATEYNFWNATGHLMYNETRLLGYDDTLGNLTLNLSATPIWLEFRWNDSTTNSIAQEGDIQVGINTTSVPNASRDVVVNLSYPPTQVVNVYIYSNTPGLLSYTDSVAVTNPNANATVNLTHTPYSGVTVYVYNTTSYGTWVLVPQDKYTANSTQVVVNNSWLDPNISTVKVDYTYVYGYTGQWISVPQDLYTIGTQNVTINQSFLDNNSLMAKVEFYYTETDVTIPLSYRCNRILIPSEGEHNITFYIRTDLPVYGESTLYINNSLVRYTYSFDDKTGIFSSKSGINTYISIYTYNTTGTKLKIHEQFWDATDQVYPWLVYGKKYFWGVHCSDLSIDKVGIAPAQSDTSPQLVIDAIVTYSYSVLDVYDISFGWQAPPTGLWIYYFDNSWYTTSVNLSVYYASNGTFAYGETSLVPFFNFSFPSAVQSIPYNFTLTFDNPLWTTNRTIGCTIFPSDSLDFDTAHLDEILNLTLGRPAFRDNSGNFVPWIYVAIFAIAFIILMSFGSEHSIGALLGISLWLMFAGASFTGLMIIGILSGATLIAVGFFILVIAIVASLGGSR